MTDLGHLRIGTADRREAVARIDRAAAEGRLTPTSGPAPASGWVEERSEMPNSDDLR